MRWFQPVSNNWGSYKFYTCDQNGQNCTFFFDNLSISDLVSGVSKDHPLAYVESVLNFFIIGLVMFLFLIIFGLLFGCCRYCCCCVKGGCCGKRYPTPKTKLLGVVPKGTVAMGSATVVPLEEQTDQQQTQAWQQDTLIKETNALIDSKGLGSIKANQTPQPKQWEYTKGQIWFARILMYTFFFSILVWILVFHYLGSEKIASAAKTAANSPTTLMNTVRGTNTGTSNLLIGLMSDSMSNLFLSINSTINQNVNMTGMSDQIQCMTSKLSNLPNVTNLLSFFDYIEGEIGSMKTVINGVPSQLDDIDAQLLTVRTKNQQLNTTLYNMTDNMALSRGLMTKAKTNMTSFSSYLNTNMVTLITSISSDIAFFSSLPSTSDKNDANTQLGLIQSNNVNSNPEQTAYLGALNTVQTKYSSQPNYTVTATKIQNYNDQINTIFQEQKLQTCNTTILLANLSTTSVSNSVLALNASLNVLIDAVANFSLAGPRSSLLSINATLFNITFDIVTTELNKIKPLLTVLPCMDKLVNETNKFNATLVQLPDSINVINNITNQLNGTLQSAVNSTEQVQVQIDDFYVSRNQFNVSDYVGRLDNTTASVQASTNQLRSDNLLNVLLNSILNITYRLNYPSTYTALKTLNDSLTNNAITAADITALNTLQTDLQTASTLLSGVITDSTQQFKGYCTNSVATTCSVDGDCGANGPCTGIGTRRCKLTQSTTCTSDSDCATANDRCLTDNTRFTNLQNKITAVSAPYATSQITTPLTDTSASITGTNTAFGVLSGEMTVADVAFANVDTSSFRSSIDSVNTGLNQFNRSSTQQDFQKLNSSISSLNFTSARTQVTSLNTSLESTNSQKAKLNDAQVLIDGFVELLYTRGRRYMSKLSANNLNTVLSVTGLSGLVTTFAEVVDDVTAHMSNVTKPFQNLTSTSLVNSTSSVRDKLDVLWKEEYANQGPIYFFFSLMGSSSNLNVSDYDTSNLGRLKKNAQGQSYPNGSTCWASTCVNNEVAYYDEHPIDFVPLTRAQLFGIPLVIPAIIAIFGLISAFSTCSYKWASCCSSCQLCLLIPVSAFVFLIGSLLWVFVIVSGDFCAGVENVGFQYVTQKQDNICTGTLGGNGTSANCSYTISSSNDVKFSLNVASTYTALMGGQCFANGVDPVAQVFTTLGDSLVPLPGKKADEGLNNMASNGTGLSLRPALKNHVSYWSNQSGFVYLKQFSNDLSTELSCANIYSSYSEIKDSFCCDGVTVLYWLVGCWLLMAWSMFWCGCNAAILGRKRFARDINGWNKHIIHDETALLAAGGVAAGAALVDKQITNADGTGTGNVEMSASQKYQAQPADQVLWGTPPIETSTVPNSIPNSQHGYPAPSDENILPPEQSVDPSHAPVLPLSPTGAQDDVLNPFGAPGLVERVDETPRTDFYPQHPHQPMLSNHIERSSEE